jgi:hypothetical protein
MHATIEALRLAKIAKTKLKEVALSLPSTKENRDLTEVHSNVIDVLLLLAEIEKIIDGLPVPGKNVKAPEECESKTIGTLDDTVSEEVEKVKRKLPRWANNPQQINSKILRLFLDLQSSGHKISETFLMEKYGDHAEFLRNFNQMKMISTNNHAKVFDVKNGLVTIWAPVVEPVSDFKKKTSLKK